MKRSKTWKKPLLLVLFITLNVAVIAITAFSEFGNSENAAELSEVKIDWWLLLPAVLCFAVATVLNIYKYVLMMEKSYGKSKKPSRGKLWKTAWRVTMLGKYYDNITPAAVGGQPFQIYYMRKNTDLAPGHASALPMVGMISGQIGFLILAAVCFIFGGVFQDNPALIVTALVGLLFFAFWPAMVAGVSFFPKPTTRFLKFIIKVLAKLHIVKHPKKALDKVETEVENYAKSIKMILKNKGLFIIVILLATLYQLLIMMIPYFVLEAFGGDMDFLKCLATTVAVTSAVYFVPTPGNSVAAEGTFFAVFSSLSTGYVFWAMLVWRFFTYYIYIIIGPPTYLKMKIEERRATNT